MRYCIAAAGQSFDMLALLVYGNESHAAELLECNPRHSVKTVFDGGEEIMLPILDIADDDEGQADVKAPWR